MERAIILTMLSRRTILFLVLSLIFCGITAYRAHIEARPCESWKASHPSDKARSSEIREPDGSYTVTFSPCEIWVEPSPVDKVFALSAFVTTIAFLGSFAQEVWRWARLRFVSAR